MFKQYREEARFALKAVQTGARFCRDIQTEMVLPALTKGDRSPVTVADFAAQAVIGRMMEEVFPEDVLVAEEGSAALQTPEHVGQLKVVTRYVKRIYSEATSGQVCAWIDRGAGRPGGRFWALDPIDGTKGFLRGGQYVVALALVVDGCVVVGALGMPNLNRKMEPAIGGTGSAIIAVRGEGAWATGLTNGEFIRLQVTDRKNPAGVRVLRSFEAAHTDTGKIDQFISRLGITYPPVLMDSQAKFAVLSAGEGELILRLLSPSLPGYHEKIWDQAAGSIVVEEAGGRVTDLRGKALDFSTGRQLLNNIGVLVSNGVLHAMALETLKAIGADRRPDGT